MLKSLPSCSGRRHVINNLHSLIYFETSLAKRPDPTLRSTVLLGLCEAPKDITVRSRRSLNARYIWQRIHTDDRVLHKMIHSSLLGKMRGLQGIRGPTNHLMNSRPSLFERCRHDSIPHVLLYLSQFRPSELRSIRWGDTIRP